MLNVSYLIAMDCGHEMWQAEIYHHFLQTVNEEYVLHAYVASLCHGKHEQLKQFLNSNNPDTLGAASHYIEWLALGPLVNSYDL